MTETNLKRLNSIVEKWTGYVLVPDNSDSYYSYKLMDGETVVEEFMHEDDLDDYLLLESPQCLDELSEDPILNPILFTA